MKVEQIKYDKIGHQRLFYIAKNEIYYSVKASVYSPSPFRSREEVEFKNLEFEVWDLDFVFKYTGKYIFIIFEDGLRTLILIVTIG